MAIKVGINGFGRIGRVVLRIMIEHPEQFDICGINLRKADLDYMVYMIKYDSVFRQFNGTVEHKDLHSYIHFSVHYLQRNIHNHLVSFPEEPFR